MRMHIFRLRFLFRRYAGVEVKWAWQFHQRRRPGGFPSSRTDCDWISERTHYDMFDIIIHI